MNSGGSYLTQSDLDVARAEANQRLRDRQNRDMIVLEILSERYRQDEKWGGPGHDDQHGPHNWIAYIVRHAGRAVMWPWDRSLFRKQMVKVGALAIAAIEWAGRLPASTKGEPRG